MSSKVSAGVPVCPAILLLVSVRQVQYKDILNVRKNLPRIFFFTPSLASLVFFGALDRGCSFYLYPNQPPRFTTYVNTSTRVPVTKQIRNHVRSSVSRKLLLMFSSLLGDLNLSGRMHILLLCCLKTIVDRDMC